MKTIIGVMGPGESASPQNKQYAEELGALIAKNGWALLSGGRKSGVMGAVNTGYKKAGGSLSIGISPISGKKDMSKYLDVIIPTNMGSGRNYINALASDIMVAIGDLSSSGTLSEVALGIPKQKPFEENQNDPPVILLGTGVLVDAILETYGAKVIQATTPDEAIYVIKKMIEFAKKVEDEINWSLFIRLLYDN